MFCQGLNRINTRTYNVFETINLRETEKLYITPTSDKYNTCYPICKMF